MEALREARDTVTQPEQLKRWVTAHQASVKAWLSFFGAVVLIYVFVSDGDFSFLLTLSSLIGLMSFMMVLYKIERAKSCSGVSLKMIECYVILIFSRLCSIIPFEGYLPYDRSGDWLYQTTEALSFCLAGTIVFMCRVRYRESYDPNTDNLNHVFLIVPAAILALIFHPSLNAFMPADIAWTFALYLEAVCALPQLFHFQREGKVEPFTTHFLAAQATSKLLSFIFWASSYSELNDHTRALKKFVGVWVIAMQLIQLAIMGDFIYHYVRCISRGVPVQFILTESV